MKTFKKESYLEFIKIKIKNYFYDNIKKHIIEYFEKREIEKRKKISIEVFEKIFKIKHNRVLYLIDTYNKNINVSGRPFNYLPDNHLDIIDEHNSNPFKETNPSISRLKEIEKKSTEKELNRLFKNINGGGMFKYVTFYKK